MAVIPPPSPTYEMNYADPKVLEKLLIESCAHGRIDQCVRFADVIDQAEITGRMHDVHAFNTGFQEACIHGDMAVVKWLVKRHEPDFNNTKQIMMPRCPQWMLALNNYEPLYNVCLSGNVELANWLVDKFRILQKDDNGRAMRCIRRLAAPILAQCSDSVCEWFIAKFAIKKKMREICTKYAKEYTAGRWAVRPLMDWITASPWTMVDSGDDEDEDDDDSGRRAPLCSCPPEDATVKDKKKKTTTTTTVSEEESAEVATTTNRQSPQNLNAL